MGNFKSGRIASSPFTVTRWRGRSELAFDDEPSLPNHRRTRGSVGAAFPSNVGLACSESNIWCSAHTNAGLTSWLEHSPNVIVGKGPRDLLIRIEVKHLCGKATTSALVVKSDAGYANEYGYQF